MWDLIDMQTEGNGEVKVDIRHCTWANSSMTYNIYLGQLVLCKDIGRQSWVVPYDKFQVAVVS